MNLRFQRYSHEGLCMERFQEGSRNSAPINAKMWFLGTQKQERALGRGLTSSVWEGWPCLAVG